MDMFNRLNCPAPQQQLPCSPPPWFEGPFPPWYPGANGGVSFGQYPPATPARGHFWWNGVILQIWDGAAWMPTGGTT
jgi:hypothetical protein